MDACGRGTVCMQIVMNMVLSFCVTCELSSKKEENYKKNEKYSLYKVKLWGNCSSACLFMGNDENKG